MDRQIIKTKTFLRIAREMSQLSTCRCLHVGAVLTHNNMIISTGYNGTPKGVRHCTDGGCARCAGEHASGSNLDKCICTHAEANTIAQAAFNGISTADTILYCTTKPCLGCVKLAINAGVGCIYYADEYPVEYPAELIENNEIIKIDVEE